VGGHVAVLCNVHLTWAASPISNWKASGNKLHADRACVWAVMSFVTNSMGYSGDMGSRCVDGTVVFMFCFVLNVSSSTYVVLDAQHACGVPVTPVCWILILR
jgi:hypothetical protein